MFGSTHNSMVYRVALQIIVKVSCEDRGVLFYTFWKTLTLRIELLAGIIERGPCLCSIIVSIVTALVAAG